MIKSEEKRLKEEIKKILSKQKAIKYGDRLYIFNNGIEKDLLNLFKNNNNINKIKPNYNFEDDYELD
jgi:hypothetical protein